VLYGLRGPKLHLVSKQALSPCVLVRAGGFLLEKRAGPDIMGNNNAVMLTEDGHAHAAENIGHFDHQFHCAVKEYYPADFVPPKMAANYAERLVAKFGHDARIGEITCKQDSFIIREEIGTSLADMTKRDVLSKSYSEITKLSWDHSVSSVKIVFEGSTIILRFENSLEIEAELRSRFTGIVRLAQKNAQVPPRQPAQEYMGMYAGPNKPKPFQRKRSNLSHRPQGKLPALPVMRQLAVTNYEGSGKPRRTNESVRMRLALEHIHKGTQTFVARSVEGIMLGFGAGGLSLVMDRNSLRIVQNEVDQWTKAWSEITDYIIVDKVHLGNDQNGVKFFFSNSQGVEDEVFVIVEEVQLAMFACEFFFNDELAARGEPPEPRHCGSRHGAHARRGGEGGRCRRGGRSQPQR